MVLSETRCRLDVGQLMLLPLTVSCFSKIQIGFTFLVPAHLGSPGKRAVRPKRVCVCVSILKITALLAYVARLPCGTLMSAKQAINDKLQGSVATYLTYNGVVNNHIEKCLRVDKI